MLGYRLWVMGYKCKVTGYGRWDLNIGLQVMVDGL